MQCASALRTLLIAVSVALLLAASPVAAQQTYVTQFDAYAGYAFLDSPRISLFENGFQAQFGYRPKPWYSLGFDYSRSSGDLVLTPDLLPTALAQPILGAITQLIAAHQLPAGYVLAVPAHSNVADLRCRPAACLSPLFAPDAVHPAIARGHPRSRRPAPRRCFRHFHRAGTGAIRQEDGLARVLWVRRRLRHPFLQARRHTHASRPGARSPVQRCVGGWPLDRALLGWPVLQLRQEYCQVGREGAFSLPPPSVAPVPQTGAAGRPLRERLSPS